MADLPVRARYTAAAISLLAGAAAAQTPPPTGAPPLAATGTPPPAPPAKPPPQPVTQVPPQVTVAILGHIVQGADGKASGPITDVLVDRNGHPRAAVIDFGGFMGLGTRKIAVDWSALRFAPANADNPIALTMTTDQIKAAPEYQGETKPAPVVHPAPVHPAPDHPADPHSGDLQSGDLHHPAAGPPAPGASGAPAGAPPPAPH